MITHWNTVDFWMRISAPRNPGPDRLICSLWPVCFQMVSPENHSALARSQGHAPVGSGWSAEQCLVLLLVFFHPAHRTQPGFQYRNTFCCYCNFRQFEWLNLIDSICHSTRGTQIGTLEKNGKTRMHPSNYCSDSTGVRRCLQVSIFKHGGHG